MRPASRPRHGAIVAVNGMCLVSKHDSYFEAEWRQQLGGDPLRINAIHDIDGVGCLCGEIETVQASAGTGYRRGAGHWSRGLETRRTASSTAGVRPSPKLASATSPRRSAARRLSRLALRRLFAARPQLRRALR